MTNLTPHKTLKDLEDNEHWSPREKEIIKMWINSSFEEGIELIKEAIKKLKEKINIKSGLYKSAVDNEWDTCITTDNLEEYIEEIFGDKI